MAKLSQLSEDSAGTRRSATEPGAVEKPARQRRLEFVADRTAVVEEFDDLYPVAARHRPRRVEPDVVAAELRRGLRLAPDAQAPQARATALRAQRQVFLRRIICAFPEPRLEAGIDMPIRPKFAKALVPEPELSTLFSAQCRAHTMNSRFRVPCRNGSLRLRVYAALCLALALLLAAGAQAQPAAASTATRTRTATGALRPTNRLRQPPYHGPTPLARFPARRVVQNAATAGDAGRAGCAHPDRRAVGAGHVTLAGAVWLSGAGRGKNFLDPVQSVLVAAAGAAHRRRQGKTAGFLLRRPAMLAVL